MEAARPSRTALRVALRRAAHQLHDAQPLVLNDPIAIPILGQQYLPELHKTVTKLEKPFSVALRAFLVARSRYAEDMLAHAVVNGVTQYVLLGAGLDTFAYRNPYPNLHVFEIDHPATQQWKRELLETSHIPIPQNLTFVPVDFEHQALPTRLLAVGFDFSVPTSFAWLGVVPYLTREAFRSTLGFIAARPHGSGVVFDYVQPRAALPHLEQLARDSLAARVQQAGEPFQLSFTPREVAAELAAFHNLEDLGSPEINSLYFANRSDNLKLLGSGGRMLSAWL
ncbi:MAG: class I SAM-dependent methyltransferase [Edaphobacter sp.]